MSPSPEHRSLAGVDQAQHLPAFVHEMVEQRAARAGDAPALLTRTESLRYAELNRRANRCAHALRELGVGPGAVVGLCTERSSNMVVAMLGILKAGAAYLPLDPSYPGERLGIILEDSQADVVLAERRVRERVPAREQVRCLLMEEIRADGADTDLHLALNPGDLAYVLFTSGSTGRPKGVAIEHRSLTARLQWARECFSDEELRLVLASTSMCFDISVFELFAPLWCGGAMLLAESVLHLETLPQRERVTLINTVPSAAAELVRSRAVPSSVQAVTLVGEPLQRALRIVKLGLAKNLEAGRPQQRGRDAGRGYPCSRKGAIVRVG